MVKLSHTLEKTMLGAESVLHTEMKPNGKRAWRKRLQVKERGLKRGARGNHEWTKAVLSLGGEKGDFL